MAIQMTAGTGPSSGHAVLLPLFTSEEIDLISPAPACGAFPIDIVQFQRNNLAGPQTHAGEQQQNGIVPLSPWGFPLAMIEGLLNGADR